MALALEIQESEVGEGFSAETSASWDSIRHLNLIMALEEAFGVTFASEEIGTLDSYAAIVHALGRLGVS